MSTKERSQKKEHFAIKERQLLQELLDLMSMNTAVYKLWWKVIVSSNDVYCCIKKNKNGARS